MVSASFIYYTSALICWGKKNVPSVHPQSRLTADKWNPRYVLQNPETKAAFRAVPIEFRWASWQGTTVLTDWGRQRGTSSLWGLTGARSGGVCGCEAPSHRDYLLLQREETRSGSFHPPHGEQNTLHFRTEAVPCPWGDVVITNTVHKQPSWA